MMWTPEKRILALAGLVLALDQLTKWIVMAFLPAGQEVVVLAGFFKLVHWTNTGAAWSLFYDNNHLLAVVSVVALIVLFLARRHFEGGTFPGQVALGLIIGGIAGNLVDRVVHHHVVDFLYFHLIRRDGRELGFPAFNVADTAICTGVGVIFLISWGFRRAEPNGAATADTPAEKGGEETRGTAGETSGPIKEAAQQSAPR